MARKQSKGRDKTAAVVQAGKRGVKKEGSKLKDLEVKGGRKIRGGGKAAGGAFEIKDFSFGVTNPTT